MGLARNITRTRGGYKIDGNENISNLSFCLLSLNGGDQFVLRIIVGIFVEIKNQCKLFMSSVHSLKEEKIAHM